ncbi:MAG: response regulator transcription factor [Chloroflexi bacterium]|nr:response regulator transcription factor [Chloroflexota bacterium]
MPDRILIVDDEPAVVEVVGLYLRREGYEVATAANGREALHFIHTQRPTLIVLDLMLPEVDGLEIIRRLREIEGEDIPVVVLSARRQETDRIYGLELGADDYLTKPFSPAELVARVRAVLRRTRAGKANTEKPIHQGELTIDPNGRAVTMRGTAVELTATEFNLLWFMATHPNQVFSRDQLLQNVWGFSDYVDPSTVTVHIRRLREKLEQDPSNPTWLLTVWGVGYKFSPPERG